MQGAAAGRRLMRGWRQARAAGRQAGMRAVFEAKAASPLHIALFPFRNLTPT